MTLLKCPACKKAISPEAVSCPQCGHPCKVPPAALVAPPAGGLPNDERRLWSGGPSVLLITGSLIRLGIWTAAAWALHRYGSEGVDWLAGEWTDFRTWLAGHPELLTEWIPWASMGIVGLAVLGFLYALLRLKSTHYRISNQRVARERGIIAKDVDDVDLRLIDETSFRQSVLQRLLGIGMVEIKSADANLKELKMRGIRGPRRVREIIRREAYLRSQSSLMMRQI